MFELTIDDRALQEAAHRFQTFSDNPTPILVKMADFLEEVTQRRFDTDTDPDGNPWAPLMPSTVAAKARKGQAPGILEATLQTRKSIQSVIVGDTIIQTADTPQSPFLQEGTSQMPARPFLGLSDKDADQLGGIVLTMLSGEYR